MPVNHRFLEHDFGNGFQTHNAILDKTPYEPEVLFVGTFNPDVPTNPSDFFYSRNYFWPVMKNLSLPFDEHITGRRVHPVGQIPNVLDPDMEKVFGICTERKMTFADLIKQVDVANIIGYKDDDLAMYGQQGLCEWSTDYIITYLRNNRSIKNVYLTRKATGIWGNQWSQIRDSDYGGRAINFGQIHTPSGQGLRERGINPAKALARRWLWHTNPERRFCNGWINQYVINPDGFNYPDHPNRLNG